MRVISAPHGTDKGWAVIAEWFGADRVVFRGTLTACLNYRKANNV